MESKKAGKLELRHEEILSEAFITPFIQQQSWHLKNSLQAECRIS